MFKRALHWPSSLSLLTFIGGLAAAMPASAAPGVTATTITIGQSAALTGPSTNLGKEMREGALAYFDEVNRQGGVHGRKIVLKTVDDAYDAERAAKNTIQLIEKDGVFALFGYAGTAQAKAALPFAEKNDVPFFAALSGGEALHGRFHPNVFNIRASNAQEMDQIAENLQGMGSKKIVILHPDDAAGKAGRDAFERALQKHHLSLAGSVTIERNGSDVAAAVTKVRAMQPSAVLLLAAYQASATFIHAMRKDAISIPYFWNLSSVGGQALATALGPDAPGSMVSQVMPSPWNKQMPLVQEYRRLYLTSPEHHAGFSSLEGFIAAKTFVAGLERAGQNVTRASFKDALESMRNVDLGGFRQSFSPTNHQGSSYVELTVIRNDGTFLY